MTVSVPELTKDARELTGNGLDVMANKHPRLFMASQHHRTTKGERMTFADKPWLTAIYKDNSRNMVVIKCSQVHMTEHALCAMFAYAYQGKRGMYVLPSKEHRKTFVSDRINRLKDFSKLYEHSIKSGSTESDSNVYKSIFGRGWKFVGSNVRKDFFEFPCEVLMFDEFDELDQDNLHYAYDRVADVAKPVIWKFGNPTRENHGIHKEFLDSDQKEWHVDCDKCGHEQILNWYEHFVAPVGSSWELKHRSGAPICSHCGQDFDRLDNGRWVALNPGIGKASGYRITRLFINKKKDPNDMVFLFHKFMKAQNNPTALQNFHNNYLGEPFENFDFKVTREVLMRSVYDNSKNLFEYDPLTFRTVMGVDQGKLFTCVISMVWGGELIDIHYANVKRWADVTKLETDFNVIQTVIDAQGGGYAETRDFVKASGNRYMCYYRPKDQVKGMYPYKIEYKDQVVSTNRTEIIDLMVQQLLAKKAHVRADYEHADKGEFMKQMLESARITDTNGRPVWTKGKDHYFHASAYRYLAWRMSGMRNSVAGKMAWHADHANNEKIVREPETKVIGQNVTPPTKSKRRGWHL